MSKTRKTGLEFLDALPEDGERRLMLAVLIDALRTLRPPRRNTTRLSTYRNWLLDRAWMKSENHTDTFSFISICNALGFDSDYIRRCVLTPAGQAEGPPIRLRRYAEKVKETWLRQSRDNLRKAAAGREHTARKLAAAASVARHPISCARRRVRRTIPFA